MSRGKVILDQNRFQLTIDRLCHQLIENYSTFENACIIGVQPRGVQLADRIVARLAEIDKQYKAVTYGKLDITFHRDDFRIREKPLEASTTNIDFLIHEKNVLLVDDVLYSGRTIQAALAAMQHFGRPAKVELLCLVDRRFNRALPIASDYVGITVDSLDEAYVKVEWKEVEGSDKVKLFSAKKPNSSQ